MKALILSDYSFPRICHEVAILGADILRRSLETLAYELVLKKLSENIYCCPPNECTFAASFRFF